LRGQVLHLRREIDAAIEPRFHGVLVGRTHVDQVTRQQRTHVIRHRFGDQRVATDDRYSAVFTRPGTYACCSAHPQMTGTIVVK
jgi:plastocyanin